MKVYLATDHAGFDLKEKVKTYLKQQKFDIEDLGAFTFNKDDDFPDFIAKAAEVISKNPTDRAIIFGGSGQGEAMLANTYDEVRAALFYGPRLPSEAIDIKGKKSGDPYEIVRLTREHNNANILSLAARWLTEKEALKAVLIFLHTPFSPAPRHERRIEKMEKIKEEI